jgi:hypothetical protein
VCASACVQSAVTYPSESSVRLGTKTDLLMQYVGAGTSAKYHATQAELVTVSESG